MLNSFSSEFNVVSGLQPPRCVANLFGKWIQGADLDMTSLILRSSALYAGQYS